MYCKRSFCFAVRLPAKPTQFFKILRQAIRVFILTGFLVLNLGCHREKENKEFQCTDDLGCVVLAPGEPVKIGVLQALTGDVASLGKDQIRGFELALEDHGGTICGRQVAVQIEDTGCTAEGGANAILKIIADPQHIAVFGTTCSGAAATAAKAACRAGLVMISGNNSAPFLTAMGGKAAPDHCDGYFRTSFNDENAGRTAAVYAYTKLGIQRAATINDGDIYTEGLTTGFQDAFEALGGKLVLDTKVDKGSREMGPVLTAVLDAGAQFLFFPLFPPEAVHILFQAKKMAGFDQVVLMGDGALINRTFLDTAKDQVQGMYFVGPAAPAGSMATQLDKKYANRYGEQPSVFYYLSGYDAAMIMFSAIETAAVKDGDRLIIGRRTLREAMYATRNVNGVTGRLTCGPFGDCSQPVFNILRMDQWRAGLAGLKSNVIFSFSPDE